MKTFYLVCGIPVSGKSSVAHEVAAKGNAVILSFQEIQQELYGSDWKSSKHKEIFGVIQTRFTEALNAGHNIVIDSVNAQPGPRKKYAIQAKKQGYRTICIFCHKHYAYAITANRLRNGEKYLDRIIMAAFERFVPPERFEGWNEIHIMDGNKYSLEVEGQIPIDRRSKQKQY